MKIAIYYSNATGLRPEFEETVREAVDATGVSAEIETIEIHSYEDAKAVRFMGSPTFRVNGIDVEYGPMEPPEYTTGSRLYNSADGWVSHPSARRIANAILEAEAQTTNAS